MIAATIITGVPKSVVKMIPTIGMAIKAPKSSNRRRRRCDPVAWRLTRFSVIVADGDPQAFASPFRATCGFRSSPRRRASKRGERGRRAATEAGGRSA